MKNKINYDGNFRSIGATLAVIIDMEKETSVIFSACIAVFYTLFGGLYSVAYTDVIQLICIFIGLWMCIPFAWTNPHVKSLSSMEVDWIGEVEDKKIWFYVDYGLLLIFGGIPWQVNERGPVKRQQNSVNSLLTTLINILGLFPTCFVEQNCRSCANIIIRCGFWLSFDGYSTCPDRSNCEGNA